MKTELVESKKSITLSPKEDTQYVLVPKGEVSVDVILDNTGVNSQLIIPYILKDNEEVNLKTVSKHTVPHTGCEVLIGCVLYDSSVSKYEGRIQVEKTGHQASSSLNDKAIILGDSVKNNSQPILEIEANDVTVSHGATTGSLQKDQIFYLMTRGFTEVEARKLLVKAFLNSLLDKIDNEKIRMQVEERLYA